MPSAEVVVRRRLGDVVRTLDGAHYQLLGLEVSLPSPPPEEGEAEVFDPVAELRSAIECVLRDHLLPAIRALDAAARRGPEGTE